MAEVKVELNREGVRELLKSREMQALVGELAEGIARRAGEGYEHDTKLMPTRAIASAYTATPDAIRDNADNNTLLRAMS